MTESALTHQIIHALNQIPGVWCWRNNTGRRGGVSYGLKGAADITGVIRGGRRLELEVKMPRNNKFEAQQPAFLARMNELGAIAGVVRSVGDAIDLVRQGLE